jgi:Ca2+-binding RTX toxin-like protein
MRRGRFARLAAVGSACGLVVISALAATNAVPASNAEQDVSAITVDEKKPKPDCNGITVTAIVTGGGNGGNPNELVLGTAAVNGNLRGGNGDDCIHGGGGNDTLRGDGGTDVCIGGPGTDSFHATCETQIQ